MSTIEFVRTLGHPNVQEYVNNGPKCSCDNTRLGILLDFMFTYGWEEIDPSIYEFEPKDMIKYVTKTNDHTKRGGKRQVDYREVGTELENTEMVYGNFGNKFRSGGWFIRFDDNDDYILYKPHKITQPPIPIQLNNIDRMFVLSLRQQKINADKKPAYYDRPGAKTEYPVKLIDKCGVEVVVYYGPTEYKQNRFTQSEKFSRAKRNGWKFK